MSPARRKWGQHWLANDELAAALVRLVAPCSGDRFVEIGPGTGRLTAALLAHPIHLLAVEIDPDCCKLLERLHGMTGQLQICNEDILAQDGVLPFDQGPLRLVGNLPYNVSSPLLRYTAEHSHQLIDAHYMVQLQVAERLLSPPGGRRYGLLSVLVQSRMSATLLRRVPPGAFRPAPRVQSAFIRLQPRPEPLRLDSHCRQVLAAAFAQRRKTLHNALRSAGWPDPVVRRALRAADLDPRVRAERLHPRDFLRLAGALPEIVP